MKKITVNKTRILTAAAALVAVFSLAGCGSNAVQEIPRSAETSRSEEATPETAAPEATATPTPTPEPTPAVVVPTSVTLEQEGGILNNGMTWTLHATVLPEDAADKTIAWTSADESVATIDDSGVITTHAPGRTPQSHADRHLRERNTHHRRGAGSCRSGTCGRQKPQVTARHDP